MPKDPFDGIFTETQPQQSSSGFDGIFQGEATTLDGFQSVQRKESSIFDAPFKSSPTDTGFTAGAKAVGNLPSSALRFGKGIYDIATNPITSAKAIGSTALGGFQKLIPGEQGNEQQFNQFTQALKQRYGSLEALQKTATEDPFGLGTDIVGLFAGGATLAGRGGQAANLASKTAKIATAPITKSATAAKDAVTSTARFATSQATGLSPSTITEVIKNPAAFAKSATNPSRTQIAEVVGNALDTRLGELSDIGSGYQEIRKAQGVVNIPANTVSNILDKYGIKLKDGKVVTSPESRPLEVGDKAAIEKFIKDYGNETTLSPNAFLNVREALSNLGDYNRLNPNGKSNISTSVARDLRSAYDSLGGQQLSGLKELDALYAPERQLLGQLKRDIFDSQGNLKDGAISKIANITGKGKEQFLERVKEVVPDIDQRIRVLKAVEDIEAASGLKVGTYARAVVGGGAIATGNIPVIIGAILSQPEVAVPLLRAYGYTGAKAAEVLRPLRTILEDVNNFRIPTPVIDYLREQQPGLSVKATVPPPATIAREISAGQYKKVKEYLASKQSGTNAPVSPETSFGLQEVLDATGIEKLKLPAKGKAPAPAFSDEQSMIDYLQAVVDEYEASL